MFFVYGGLTQTAHVCIFVCMELDFYRIECEETGLGPYQSGEYGAVLAPSSERHPTPWNEGLWDRFVDMDYEDQRSFVCGFKSIEQLTTWFDIESLKRMRKSAERGMRHYNIIRFQIHEAHMRIGRCQAVARRPFLREVTRHSLQEFIETLELTSDRAAIMVGS